MAPHAHPEPGAETADPRAFQLAIRALADALVFGQEPSRFRGPGIEFEQTRPYQPGDPVRHIDWRVSARTGRPHLKEYEAPRQVPVILLLDTSASMRLSSVPGTSKFAVSLAIAGGLALAALDRVNPVGFAGLGSSERHRPPTTSRPSILQTLEEFRAHPAGDATAIAPRLRGLLPSLRSKSTLVCLSDLHDPEAFDALKAAAQLHDCLVIRPRDPAEETGALAGIIRSAEAETARPFTLGLLRKPAPRRTLAELTAAAIDCIELPIERPFLPALRGFLSGRSRRKSNWL